MVSSAGALSSGRPSHVSAVAWIACPPTPQSAARRDLHQRQQRACNVAQRLWVAVGPLFGQKRAQVGKYARLLLKQHTTPRPDRIEVEARQALAIGAFQATLDHSLEQRAHRQAVARAHQVDGRSHQRDPHSLAVGEQLGQLGMLEAFQPRPQADIGRVGRLRLHADKMIDHIDRRHRNALEQVLPRQQRAVERAPTQHLSGPG